MLIEESWNGILFDYATPYVYGNHFSGHNSLFVNKQIAYRSDFSYVSGTGQVPTSVNSLSSRIGKTNICKAQIFIWGRYTTSRI